VTDDPAPETIRYRADAVVTVDGAGAVHRPGVLDVAGDRIAWVGPAADAPPFDGPLQSLGGLLMPGFVNTHAHTPMTLLRGAGDGLPLIRWLHEAIWPREARMSGEDARWGMLLGCDELLRCGVTTTCEQYAHNRAVADAALEAGIRCVLTPGIFEFPGGEPEDSWQYFLAEAEALYDEYDGRDGLLTVGFGPHSSYMLPPEALPAIAEAAAARDALVQIHLAETANEDDGLRAAHGCSAPELLSRLGLLDCRVLAAHSVWLSDADLDLYRRHDVAVAHCPSSNAKLGSGVARLTDMLARGIRVGLGTDSPASNDRLDVWEEMRLAGLLARAVTVESTHVTTAQALHLATRGGAEALGLDTGSLEFGRPADFIRVDLADDCWVPDGDDTALLARLVWAASSRLVTDAWVGGRQVVGEGKCLTVDAAEARREVDGRAARLDTGPEKPS
jgi:5-methylthioadenosine/S-adenosylhomocysteine deaminase